MKKVAFERSEFEARVLRTQKAMHAHELGALLVTAPANVRYYTGFDTQFWESPTRPWFVVVPAEGSCTAVVPEIGEPLFAESWIRDIRAWPAPRPADDGVSLLAAVIEPLARRQRRVGIEMGRESSLRMPLVDFFALRDRLSGLDLVDGMPCI